MNQLSSTVASPSDDRYLISAEPAAPIKLVKGQGCRVWDGEGREYLDFYPGGGSNLLGHCPPTLIDAIDRQMRQMILSSRQFQSELAIRWAQMLVDRSFDARVFFCNSGAEACEAAIRLTRNFQGPQRYKIIAFHGASHGKTLGALAASGQATQHVGAGPLAPGFSYGAIGDLDQVQQRIDSSTAAIMIEPVQVEAGVRILTAEFLRGLRDLCDQNGLLLIFDEVQTGCGKTGRWFAYQHSGVQPDVMTLAKGLCGGIAAGAMMARRELTENIDYQLFESTFGGNPIACAAGITVIETIEKGGLLDVARDRASLLTESLAALQNCCSAVRNIRQSGLIIGIELNTEAAPIVHQCIRNGLLIHGSQTNVLRLCPPLNVTHEEIDRAIEILSSSIAQVTKQMVTEQMVADQPNSA